MVLIIHCKKHIFGVQALTKIASYLDGGRSTDVEPAEEVEGRKKRRLNRINENETSTSGKKAKLDENHKERSAEQIEKDKSGAAPKESAEKGWQSQIV